MAMHARQVLSSKITVFLLGVLLLTLGIFRFQQYQKQQAIEREKARLGEQARELQQKNRELQESLAYLNSANYKERTARESLNLKRDGEMVYNFSVRAEQITAAPGQEAHKSNPVKWWEYFFRKNR